jgi:hypothetical protein
MESVSGKMVVEQVGRLQVRLTRNAALQHDSKYIGRSQDCKDFLLRCNKMIANRWAQDRRKA